MNTASLLRFAAWGVGIAASWGVIACTPPGVALPQRDGPRDAAASLDATRDAARPDARTRDAAVPRDGAPDGHASTADAAGNTTDAALDGGALDAAASDAALDAAQLPAFDWQLPSGFPVPAVPDDNPMSAAKVELGRYLFYDTRLSANRTQACASCHEQARAFTDGRATSLGSTGSSTPRNAQSLANVAYAATLTWANPLQTSLERQALVPLFGDNPVELGMSAQADLEARLLGVALYQQLFRAAFPDDGAITTHHVVQALASFQRTLLSGSSPFDRWLYGSDPDALSASAKRGYELFNSERLECFHCHVGFNLTDHVTFADDPFYSAPFHNTGLYNIDGKGAYPEPNTGVYDVTRDKADMGRFKAPTLRNIALTAPYMHDGSIATLGEVLDHYAAGGRTIASGANAGNGSASPRKSVLIAGFELSASERADVLAFLESLTDEQFVTDPRFSNPWAD